MKHNHPLLTNSIDIDPLTAPESVEQHSPIILDADGELQGAVFCLSCGSLNTFGDEMCGVCGQTLLTLDMELPGYNYCFVCGSPNEYEDTLCSLCGAPLDERALERRSAARRYLIGRLGMYSSHLPFPESISPKPISLEPMNIEPIDNERYGFPQKNGFPQMENISVSLLLIGFAIGFLPLILLYFAHVLILR